MKYGFGVDLGGTTVKIAYFDETGNMLDKWEIPTVIENSGSQILPDIAASIQGYLKKNITVSLDHPFATLYLAILGSLGVTVLRDLASILTFWLVPEYVNLNDQSIQSQLADETTLMLLTTVVLAPITEECFFRGLLFRGLYDRSPAAAWVASVGLFSVVHVAAFIGRYSPLALLASFIAYLPAGVVLCVTYRRSGGIIAPILAHAMLNLQAALAILR